MSARLQSVLQDLRDQCGATAADLTADELERLVFACAKVDSPFSEIDADLMDRPIRVCPGVYLWPITVGAHVWLKEFAEKWWRDDSPFYKWVLAFVLSNARNPDAFAPLTSKGKARAAILKCSLRFCCNVSEMLVAIERAFGIDRYDVPKKRNAVQERAQVDFASLVARLEVASGIPAKSWLWGRSAASLMKSYAELTELSVAAFGSRKSHPRNELDEAIENLARVCAAIGERIKNDATTITPNAQTPKP